MHGQILLPFSRRRDLSAHLSHTPGHKDCPACARSQATYKVKKITASMGFLEASTLYLEMRTLPPVCGSARFVAPRTLRDDRQYVDRLHLFLGDVPLEGIGVGTLAAYQRARLAGEWFVDGERRVFERKWGREVVQTSCGASRINQELGLLQRILRMARAWDADLELYYRKLDRQDSEVERALTLEEQERFFEVAASHPAWETIYCYSLVALHTCFSSDEMRTIRQGDINLHFGILAVNRRHGKNSYRRRQVSLTDGACLWALERLLERAQELGSKGPQMYLFPARIGRKYEGTVPIGNTGLRKPFLQVREAAGLDWFCINGWRHTAITRLAEAGVPIPIIQARAGHSSPKMTAHYTQISEAAQRLAIERAGSTRRLVRKPPLPARGAEWGAVDAMA